MSDPIVVTEEELLETFSGGEPGQIAMRNLIHTMFSLVGSDITPASLTDALAGLTGAISIGDSSSFITINGSATLNGGGDLNITNGSNLVTAGGSNVNVQDDGILTVASDSSASFAGHVKMTGILTADGATGELWRDDSSARVVKVSF